MVEVIAKTTAIIRRTGKYIKSSAPLAGSGVGVVVTVVVVLAMVVLATVVVAAVVVLEDSSDSLRTRISNLL